MSLRGPASLDGDYPDPHDKPRERRAQRARAGNRPQLCILDVDGCLLDEWRFFDPVTQQWGYEVVCLNDSHTQRCPREGEMFRLAPRG